MRSPSHGQMYNENLVQLGHVVHEICLQTNIQTQKQKDVPITKYTSFSYQGQSNSNEFFSCTAEWNGHSDHRH